MRKFIGRKKERKFVVSEEDISIKIHLPRGKEMFGKVEQLHGGKRMTVICADGKLRMCRVPGKLRMVWVRAADYVLIEPWPVESDKKADIVWRYRHAEVDWLRRHGYLKDL